MPLIQIDLTDEETARLDAIADREKRARKHQAHVLLIAAVEADETAAAPTHREPIVDRVR